jgi:chemotaxis protein histidine kinase CheA
VGLVKNNLGVLHVLGGHLTAARDLFQSSLAILHKSHAASHPLLISVRANLEQVEAHLVNDAATGPGTIDVRQLKRYFHGQHFYYSPFGDTKREEKMQKAEEAQAQQEQGDKKKPIPPEWQKLFAQANIDVAALSYEKAQALIAALKKKLTDPSPVGGAAKQDADRSRLTQSALVPHSTGDSDQGRADLLRSQPARMRLAPIKPIAPIAPIAPITSAPVDPSAYYASADHDDNDPYGYAGGPPPTPVAPPPAEPTGTAYYSDDFYSADNDPGVPLDDAMHEGYAGAAVKADMAASVYAYAEGAPVSSDDAAVNQSLASAMLARRTAATASGSDDDDEGWDDEPFQPTVLLEQATLITGGGSEQQPDDPMAAMELEEENAIRHALALEKESSEEESASRQRLEEITRNLAEVREIAGQVVEDMVYRADSLENIESRTEELAQQAEHFRRGSKELQRPSLLSRLPSISSVFSRFLGTTRQASESVRTN